MFEEGKKFKIDIFFAFGENKLTGVLKCLYVTLLLIYFGLKRLVDSFILGGAPVMIRNRVAYNRNAQGVVQLINY